MADKEYMKFYKDTKYWNMDLREEFLNETRTLWETTHADKRVGRIFNSNGGTSLDFTLTMEKVNGEME
mgnify:FL=1|jgi:hypothetical protein